MYFCKGVNGNRELWLAILHSRKVKEVFNTNDIFWLVKQKAYSTTIGIMVNATFEQA